MIAWNADRAGRIAAREGLDAFVATAPCNVAYLSGYWSPGGNSGTEPCFAVRPAKDPEVCSLITFRACVDQVVDLELPQLDVRTYGDFFYHAEDVSALGSGEGRLLEEANRPGAKGGQLDAVAETIRSHGLQGGVIALDEKGLTYDQFQYLCDAFPKATWRRGYSILRELRAVKKPEEVERLRAIARITEDAMHRALSMVREGITELETSRAVASEMVANDATPILLAVGFGTKSAHPNSLPSSRRLSRGDIIRLDVGARRLLYHSDLARAAVLGRPSERIDRYYMALLAGQQAALDLARPGARASDLFATAVETVRASGIPHYSRNAVGHGIGLEFYDEPIIKADSEAVLEEGMVINIETPYYELGFGGLQTEDTVVVTASGYDFLTSGQRPLYTIHAE